MGGTADVDLVLIHEFEPLTPREIVPLSDEVHLDISHHAKRLYQQPRDLRIDPWLGPSMCEPVFLHDPDHFFEWAQASVRGQFHRPDNVHTRGAAFLERARETLQEPESEKVWLSGWLRTLLEAANAVASLDGFPAAGRRVMPQLQSKLTAVGHPDIYDQVLQLLGADSFESTLPEGWLVKWADAFDAASEQSLDPELAIVRRDYHMSGFNMMVEHGSAVEILWPLLSTWDRSIQALPFAGKHRSDWAQVLGLLGLSMDQAGERESELEILLDQIEGVLEYWAEKVGA